MTYWEEIINKDYHSIALEIQEFIAQNVKESSTQGVVIGLSGGLDSSVTVFLAAKALSTDRILGLILPDRRVTPLSDIKDAELIARLLGIRYEVIDIAPIHQTYCKDLPRNKLAEGNLRARIRMSLLYYYANLERKLVIGTGDRSELLLGYFTKHGDGGVDLLPLGSLFKSQVRSMAKWLGLPNCVAEKRSSPRLWKGQEAEVELGLRYDVIDQILYLLLEKGLSEEEVSKKLGRSRVTQVLNRYRQTEHKRVVPCLLPLSKGRNL